MSWLVVILEWLLLEDFLLLKSPPRVVRQAQVIPRSASAFDTSASTEVVHFSLFRTIVKLERTANDPIISALFFVESATATDRTMPSTVTLYEVSKRSCYHTFTSDRRTQSLVRKGPIGRAFSVETFGGGSNSTRATAGWGYHWRRPTQHTDTTRRSC